MSCLQRTTVQQQLFAKEKAKVFFIYQSLLQIITEIRLTAYISMETIKLPRYCLILYQIALPATHLPRCGGFVRSVQVFDLTQLYDAIMPAQRSQTRRNAAGGSRVTRFGISDNPLHSPKPAIDAFANIFFDKVLQVKHEPIW